MEKQIINRELNKLDNLSNNGIYWYFYAIILDGKPCAKFGKSTVHLGNRIYSYLVKEHESQKKNWNTFSVICVIEFNKESCIKYVEGLIKEHAKDYPLNAGQHFNTEQYNLEKVWKAFGEFIKEKKFPFAKKIYLIENVDVIIKNIVDKSNRHISVNSNINDNDIIQNNIIEKKQQQTKKKITNNQILLQYINQKIYFINIPGIGPILSERLENNLPFNSLSEILNVNGIGISKYTSIINYVKSKAFDYYLNLHNDRVKMSENKSNLTISIKNN